MATGTTVDVLGVKELIQNLEAFGADIQYKAAQRMTSQGAKKFKEEVQKRVPVETGQLKRSIRVMKLSRGRAGLISYAVTAYSGQKYGKDSDGWYAHIVEYGSGIFREGGLSKRTSRFKVPGGGWVIAPRGEHRYKSGRISSYGSGKKALSIGGSVVSRVIHRGGRPKPFFRPAWDESKYSVLQAMKLELANSVKRYKARALRGAVRIANVT